MEHHDKNQKRSSSTKIEWNIEAQPQACPFKCGKIYSSTIGIKTHLQRFHLNEQKTQTWKMPEFVFQCSYCQYSCNRRSNLERHMNRYHIEEHENEKKEQSGVTRRSIEPAVLDESYTYVKNEIITNDSYKEPPLKRLKDNYLAHRQQQEQLSINKFED